MTLTDRWLLPEGIDEVLPPEAARIERLRRHLLDLFAGWGYELVMPPLTEYLESLLSGLGRDLDLQTFKLTDPLTGRLMGVRADMTPQVARIDAHRLAREGPVRLCYIGPVLHALPQGFIGSRNPLQVGAELYGHADIDADVEVLDLLLEALALAGLEGLCVNVNHIGIFRGLTESAGLDDEREAELFGLLRSKARPEIAEALSQWGVAERAAEPILALTYLDGEAGVLAQARERLAGAGAGVETGLEAIARLVDAVGRRNGAVRFHVDLADMRGFNYHTGVMFEVYAAREGQSIAWGGRYDAVGRVFGRSRPATGFSADLKHLAGLARAPGEPAPRRVFAPAGEAPGLREAIAQLRGAGETVIVELPGQDVDARAMGCTARLVEVEGRWEVEEL